VYVPVVPSAETAEAISQALAALAQILGSTPPATLPIVSPPSRRGDSDPVVPQPGEVVTTEPEPEPAPEPDSASPPEQQAAPAATPPEEPLPTQPSVRR
jgi:hypothetical protein